MSFAARFRNYFFAGILVTAPVVITLWLAWKIIGFVDDIIKSVVPVKWHPETYLPFSLPGLGIVVILVVLILIGSLTSGFFGKLLVRGSGWILNQIPVISSIYGWTRQIMETVLSEDSTAFREVVLVEYPCRGSWAIGFITGETTGEVQEMTSETVYNVFVPATPNPTTGFLLFLPDKDICRLDIAVDDGIKLVISGGIVKPPGDSDETSDWGNSTVLGVDLDRIRAELDAIEDSYVAPLPLLTRLRDYLVTGALVTAPIVVTVWVCLKVVNAFDENVMPLFPDKWNPSTYLHFGLPGLGLVIAVLSITLIGFLTASFLGNAILTLGERVIGRLPFVSGLYTAVKQIFETLFKNQSDAFREVVLVQYPRPGSWAIGFITGEATSQVQQNSDETNVNIFLPTTPNPTSGFLLFHPRAETYALTMTVEEGLKMVISGGIVTPDVEKEEEAAEEEKETMKEKV